MLNQREMAHVLHGSMEWDAAKIAACWLMLNAMACDWLGEEEEEEGPSALHKVQRPKAHRKRHQSHEASEGLLSVIFSRIFTARRYDGVL